MMTVTTDLETLLADKINWEFVASIIRAEMVPEKRMAEIATDFPEFWRTMIERKPMQ